MKASRPTDGRRDKVPVIGRTHTGTKPPKGRWEKKNPEEKNPRNWFWVRVG
jgi:hypothetical protein